MKNMIIALACVFLMAIGLLYQVECTRLLQTKTQYKWLGEEICEMAVYLKMEKDLAEEQIYRQMGESKLTAGWEDKISYRIDFYNSYVTVTVDGGYFKTGLPFLREEINLKTKETRAI